MKPTFLVIGAMKSATSTLCALLGDHPDVFMTSPKEPEFFCDDAKYALGMRWYEALFESAGGARARGEGTTSYSKHREFPLTAERIAKELPDVRLIYIVRHPLDRIESQWGYHQRIEGFGSEIDLDTLRRDERILDPSRYFAQITVYRERFPDERILPLFYSDLQRDPGAVVRRAFEFLGVDPDRQRFDNNLRLHESMFRVDRPLLVWLKRWNLFQRAQRAVPMRWKKPVRPLLQTEIDRPTWQLAARRYAIELLRPDAERFLDWAGRPRDLWTWNAEAIGTRSAVP